MGSFHEAQLMRELQQRVLALEALVAADPAIERIQRLEMRIGSLQGQINLMRSKAPVAAPDAPVGVLEEKADAAA